MEQLRNWGDHFSFLEPEKLLLFGAVVPLFLLFVAFWGRYLFRRRFKTFGSHYPLLGGIKFWLLMMMVLALLITAWARPVLEHHRLVARSGAVELVFLVDGSSSMLLKGLGWSRLDLATREIAKLLEGGAIKEGDRLALFLFGRASFLRVHLSHDLERFARELSRIGRPQHLLFGNEHLWGSDIVTALAHLYLSLDAQDKFQELGGGKNQLGKNWRPRPKTNRLVIIFSDGDFFFQTPKLGGTEPPLPSQDSKNLVLDDRQKLNQILTEMRRRGLKIYAVGIGSRRLEKLTDILKDYQQGKNPSYDTGLEAELKNIYSGLKMDDLNYLARATGGATLAIDRLSASADHFLKEAILAHRSLALKRQVQSGRQELWPHCLLLALGIFLLAVISR